MNESTGCSFTTLEVSQSANTMLHPQSTRIEEQFIIDDEPLHSEEPFNSDFIPSAVRQKHVTSLLS